MKSNQITYKINHLKAQLDKLGSLNFTIRTTENISKFYNERIEKYIYLLHMEDDVIFNKPL